jgi:hypothetical protein
MRVINYRIFDEENISLIYSSLNSISDKGREYLKNIAQSLIAIQNRLGTPVPDSICRDIMQNSTNNLFKEVR